MGKLTKQEMILMYDSLCNRFTYASINIYDTEIELKKMKQQMKELKSEMMKLRKEIELMG